ncbi:MAG: outer membrane beta-barrel protein [Ignavibacteriales bacterium]|nr:MAG: outer membrane beta-barrel protein [Ignavibacteriaceae bacterium]MBW7872788.1 outer membrane beta-barrel protein [Ignavibacteria bacterium]MCZ2143508.1 outer membrane beta-barrel protein [Ignavibacteriales bacterium]OQY74133.1 MAG: hypothetical protein B6D45_07235 [Ignavibacteriales bacterium UTCHB3]MBV6444384.1 hypothetical protein [Ignavibacteriaceae bacterium]
MKKFHLLLLVLFFAPLTFSQLPTFKLGVGASTGIPMGAFSDWYNTGFGAHATLIFPTPVVEVSATVGYLSFGSKVTGASALSLVPITANARYYFSPVALRPYGEVSAGLGIMSGGGSSETKHHIAIGVGILTDLAPKIDLDVNAKYNLMGHKFYDSSSPDGSAGTYLGINAGIRFKL